MRNTIAWWAANPVAANLLMLGILLAGLLGFVAMEREAFPVFKPNQVVIEVIWPGAAPQEVEEQVVIRLEAALNGLDSVYRHYATATEGMARIEVHTMQSQIWNLSSMMSKMLWMLSTACRGISSSRVLHGWSTAAK